MRSLQGVDRTNEYMIYCNVLNEGAFPLRSGNFKKIVSGRFRMVEAAKSKALPLAFKISEFMEETVLLREIKRASGHVMLKAYRALVPRVGGAETCDVLHYMLTVLP